MQVAGAYAASTTHTNSIPARPPNRFMKNKKQAGGELMHLLTI